LGVENGREKWVLEFGVVWVIFIEVEFGVIVWDERVIAHIN
jgi:hypothetical protein